MRAFENSQDAVSTTPEAGIATKAFALIEQKIWLPKTLYDGLPWFYVLASLLSLAATLYISTRFWELPQYFLFSAACLNLGIFIVRRRRRPKTEID